MRGSRLREVRELRQMTQHELAVICGLSDKQIGRYENGESDATGDYIEKISRALGVTADYLLGLVDKPDQHLTEEGLSPIERKLILAVRQGLIVEALETVTAISKGNDKPIVAPGQPAIDS